MSRHATCDDGFSSGEAIRFGWKTAMANRRPLLLIAAGSTLLFFFDVALGSAREPLAGLCRVIVQGLQVALAMVWMRAALKLSDGQKLEPPLLAGQLGGYFTFLLTWIVYVLIVGIGLLMFIVPGVVWALELGFAGFLVVDRKLDPIQALRASKYLAEGVKGRLFGFAAMLVGLNLIGLLAFGIGVAVTVPVSFIAAASVYRRLLARAERRRLEWTLPVASAS